MWRLSTDENGNDATEDLSPQDLPEDLLKTYHKTIKKVGEDIESLSFNTAISQMMILVNDLQKSGKRPKFILKTLAQLMAPFGPHISEEIWSKLGGEGLVSVAPWPEFNPDLVVDDTVTMGVQVNGKMRGKIEIAVDADEEAAVGLARTVDSVQNAMDGKDIVKVIYRPGRILNLIVK